MTLLEISQIIFYLSASLLIMLALFVLGFVAYESIVVVRSIKGFMQKLKTESSLLYQRLDSALAAVAKLSLFSKFFNSKKNK